jgi:toxin FitB
MPRARRPAQQSAWPEHDLRDRFAGRVLVIDERVADEWGRLSARAQAAGRPLGVMDAFIAATAHAAGLTLVTRNASDVVVAGVAVHNPWAT